MVASDGPPQKVQARVRSRPTTFHCRAPSLVGGVRLRNGLQSDMRAPLERLSDHNTRRELQEPRILPQNVRFGFGGSAVFGTPRRARGRPPAAGGGGLAKVKTQSRACAADRSRDCMRRRTQWEYDGNAQVPAVR
jgi:hypothetical protein